MISISIFCSLLIIFFWKTMLKVTSFDMSELQKIFCQNEIRNVINYVHITDKQILVLKLNELELNFSNPCFFLFSLQEQKQKIYMRIFCVIFDSWLNKNNILSCILNNYILEIEWLKLSHYTYAIYYNI